jgi:signal transduction histidine kinase
VCLAACLAYFTVTADSYRDLTDAGLRERALEIEDYIHTYGAQGINLQPYAKQQFEFNQVIDDRQHVVIASSIPINAAPVLPKQVTDGIADRQVLHRTFDLHGPAMTGQARLRASVLRYAGHRYVIVVGSRLDAIDKARRRLMWVLGIAVPGSFVTAGLLVYLMGSAGLRGIRRLAQEADDLSSAVPVKQLGPQSTLELQELADHLNAMLRRLGETSHNELTFIASASHDLRGAMANVLGQIEYAGLLEPGPQQHQQVLDAKESAHRAAQYLNDLLNTARLRGGPVSSEDREPVDLARVAGFVSSAAMARFAGKEVVVSGAATVLADPTDMRQALGNLVDNAVRHADRLVTVELASDGETAAATVTDDGPGFPERIFEVFDEPLPRYGNLRVGSGLGLVTARDAAKRNGGVVELSNTAAGGRAVLRLPIPPGLLDDEDDDAMSNEPAQS